MQTDCTADLFGFAAVEGPEVVARFDAGSISSDAGGLVIKGNHLDGEQTSTWRHGRSPRHATGCQRPRRPSKQGVDVEPSRSVGTSGVSPSWRTTLPMASSRDWAPAALHPPKRPPPARGRWQDGGGLSHGAQSLNAASSSMQRAIFQPSRLFRGATSGGNQHIRASARDRDGHPRQPFGA